MTTLTQAQAEVEVRSVVIDRTDAVIDREQISDCVDVYLASIERDLGRPIDRDHIDRDTVARLIETVVSHVEG
ncbi:MULTISPECIES: hypothetical protein [Dietzia]|uniref:Uncharacterized protein n=1 Tax=Dietzia cinnamea TaxID=321318 RepID=A0AAW5QB82_9ACTN|nr:MULTISPECIES: hypothetical protein [Dietzia]MBM7232141.1 hypothetical protein [Dietzia cinnamea]MCT1865273.1 hypothetical protein [Dietzia cinnamea]MCT2030567.1 hypothetical protein [Dietzia cinnamea]MCT2034093.1 hypothetical protein [Dietzia cinnamea]MCT2062448.1 hypothetical protein [Dietzia cinnamea]